MVSGGAGLGLYADWVTTNSIGGLDGGAVCYRIGKGDTKFDDI